MRNLAKATRWIVLTAAFLCMLGLPAVIYADDSVADTPADISSALNIEQSTPSGGEAGAEQQTISEGESPLSPQPYERGWSLVNLLISLLTIIIGIGLVALSMVQRQRDGRVPENFGLTVFGMASAVISTILFTSTEDIQAQMVVIDNFTTIHITVLGVSLLCVFLFLRKDLQKDKEDSSSR
ncbi:MAG: hypothetical protein LBP24_02960 [Coriobacteriales bacterium]|jgi:hypothetical protein|nr:hypothetical protein [Coriobacteriales bacterium]